MRSFHEFALVRSFVCPLQDFVQAGADAGVRGLTPGSAHSGTFAEQYFGLVYLILYVIFVGIVPVMAIAGGLLLIEVALLLVAAWILHCLVSQPAADVREWVHFS